MKVLIADRISPIGVDLFKSEDGFEVVEAYGSSPEQILELVRDVDAIAVRSDTKITADVIALRRRNLRSSDVQASESIISTLKLPLIGVSL